MQIGFISFRISGNDGVSLEADRWRTALERLGHKVIFIAGELDKKGICMPLLHFTIPQIHRLHESIIENNVSFENLEKDIFSWSGKIEGELRDTLRRFNFDRLIVANIFSLPLHPPLTIALDRTISEYKIPTISRNHDFWWERERYSNSILFGLFSRFFPPQNPLIQHVTISSIAQSRLKKRTGIDSLIIADSFDFKSTLSTLDSYSKRFRKDFGIDKGEIVFLQPTRIVPRKNIELSIELIKRLNDKHIIFVLAGDPSDEGLDYTWKLHDYLKRESIKFLFIGHRVKPKRRIINNQRYYTLWDCFANSDFITYPSAIEGFGNQFIEAVYFKKPILVNRYPVFKADLEPLGFGTVSIDGKITEKTIQQVKSILNNDKLRTQMVEKNFSIGSKYFSFEALGKKLIKLGF